MASQNIASALVSVITGVGATAVYANMQKATPVSTNAQLGVGGASALFSTIYMMETYPRISYPKALTYGTALTIGFYGVGAVIGAGLSLLADNNKPAMSRHEDV
jgi:hypothetical protein